MASPSTNIRTRIQHITDELALAENCDDNAYVLRLWKELKCLRELLRDGPLTDLDGGGTVSFEEEVIGLP